MARDLFGLKREEKIKASGVRNIFTPHQPIQSIELFWGRQKQVQQLVEHINTPGQHALLYGDRGVGKSSLANVAADLLISSLIEGQLYKKRCDSRDTFATILDRPLRDFGLDARVTEFSTSSKKGGEGGLKIPIVKAGVHAQRETKTVSKPQDVSPSVVAEHLQSCKGLLLIDETDAISSADEKRKIAELIKLLSDNGSEFKLLVVGIADTAAELTGAHPSIQRCLKETKLDRMTPEELSLIVSEGAAKLEVGFSRQVTRAIVRLSSGYPHFTHLLALKCAEEAVANDLELVDLAQLEVALLRAVDEAEGSLRRSYENAVRSYNTDMYRTILCAAASLDRVEFSAGQLRTAIKGKAGKEVTQASLNNFLTRLLATGNTKILARKAKGVYKFTDPRMPSFIRIVNKETGESV
jgi:Cdc6-like AAA superfamily ATPase